MIVYLFMTILLSMLGTGIYLLLKPSTILLKQRRQILYTLVFLSFTLPFLMSVLPQINGRVSKIDQNIGATCQALLYKSNEFLNSWISNKEFLINTGGIIMLLLLLVFIGRIGTLLYVVYISQKQVLTLGNQTYHILYTDRKISIGSFRLWNKYLIWPELVHELNEEEKITILWHEIAHLNQRNTFQKVSLELINIIWFFNPVIYWLKRELNDISEYLADEDTVDKTGDRVAYVKLLVRVKEQQQLHFTQSFRGGSLKKRVLRLLNSKKINYSKGMPVLILISLLLTVSVFAVQPKIEAYKNKIILYEQMSQVNHDTGRTEFCTQCLKQCLKPKD